MSGLLAKIIDAEKTAGLAIDFHRAQNNLIDQTGAYNQKGLEYALEESVRNKSENIAFIKVSFQDLGKYNELYGHEKTDAILQQTKNKLTELDKKQRLEYQIYRVGADWVVFFSNFTKKDIQKLEKIKKKINNFSELAFAGGTIPVALAAEAAIVSPQKNNLATIYKIMDHLKPAKGPQYQQAIYEKYLDPENGRLERKHNIVFLSNLKTNQRFLDVSDSYLLSFKRRVKELEAGISYKELQDNIIEEMRRKLSTDYENIEMIEILDYSVNYRVIGDRRTFIDDKTLIIPLINIYNKPVGALKLKLKTSCASWNKGEKLENQFNGQNVFRLERRKREYLKFNDPLMVSIGELLESASFKETVSLLIDLRRYSPALSLLDQTGRSPFFGRAVESFLEKLKDLAALTEEGMLMPEYELINYLVAKDGFVIVKRGGEEFFIYFKTDNGPPVGLSFDYNKFSRHAVSWGETAGDLYMERTSGLLRHYLSQEINLLRRADKLLTQDSIVEAFARALKAVNERRIEFEVDDLGQSIIDKAGRYIFAAENEKGETVLFAARSAEELNEVIASSNEKLKKTPIFEPAAILTRKKLLKLNGIETDNERVIIDLNSVLAVNPKGIYSLADGKLKGQADQQLLRGLSLAGGIVEITGTVAGAISLSEELAEEEKEVINRQKVRSNSQSSSIKRGEKNESNE